MGMPRRIYTTRPTAWAVWNMIESIGMIFQAAAISSSYGIVRSYRHGEEAGPIRGCVDAGVVHRIAPRTTLCRGAGGA